MANAALFIVLFLTLFADAVGAVYALCSGNWGAVLLPYKLGGPMMGYMAAFVRVGAIIVNLLVLRGSYRSQGNIFGMPDAVAFGVSLASPGLLLLVIVAMRVAA